MDMNKDLTGVHDRIDKLLQYVHARIEERFKDFRHAFRSFDKNFDGGLNFKEFITGMESIGVKLKLSDYRLIFDAVDYDNEGEIGFSKFCLFN
jgi:Ca2+-binding EF-hand superfamily protein